jgi:type I restriction enzyme S subunit
MSVEKKVPEVRFEGFLKDWNQRKLDTIFGKIRNAFVGTATPYYVKEGHFYLESNNIKNGKINRKNEIFINDEFYYKQSDKWLREGDIVMVQSGHVGHTAVIPPELNNIAAHALIMFTDPKEGISSHFLNFQFQTDKVKAKLSEVTTGNTIKHILSSEMKEFEMFFSDYEEQTQIGNYFQKLDTLINQHQQKHDKLSNIKNAMLEKMFPKQGETIPEIRFKGFSEEWVENNLGELIDIRSAARVHKEQWTEAGVPFFRTSDVVSIYKGHENTKAYIPQEVYNGLSEKIGKVKKDDLLITGGGSIGIPYLVPNDNSLYFKDADLLWLKNNKKINGYFLYTFFFSAFFKQHIKNISHTGTIAHYTIEQAKATPINTCSEKEQTAIGNYFQKLDALINQHQQQITKLTNIKQACLSKMFV